MTLNLRGPRTDSILCLEALCSWESLCDPAVKVPEIGDLGFSSSAISCKRPNVREGRFSYNCSDVSAEALRRPEVKLHGCARAL